MKAPNALTIAYRAIHGQDAPEPQVGKTGAPKRKWRDLEVDANLKDEWLEALNSIEEIDVVSTEEGENELRPAHVVFRFADPAWDKEAETVSEILNTFTDVHSLADIGNNKRPRIVVAGDIRSGTRVIHIQAKWEIWWWNIPLLINTTLNMAGIRNRKKRLDTQLRL